MNKEQAIEQWHKCNRKFQELRHALQEIDDEDSDKKIPVLLEMAYNTGQINILKELIR